MAPDQPPPTAPRSTTPQLLGLVSAGWPAGLSWEWDARLTCALSTVSQAREADALAVLATHLPAAYTSKDLGTAPALVQQICGRTGGLQKGQKVFTAPLADGAVAYCLWWPWGGAAMFSARIGVAGGPAGLEPSVRAAFGLR